MGRNQNDPTEQILNLTLEIILLLTGEEYFVVKRPGGKATNKGLKVVEGSLRANVIHEQHNQKVLNLTRKMMELLTGEVPIKYQDVAVYLSMEEWEYIEGHKDLYQDVMMEDQQPRTSPGLPKDGTNEDPPMQEQYEGNTTNPNINPPTDDTQQNPSPTIKEELVSCNGINMVQPTEEKTFTYIKEEPVPCNGGILPDPNIHARQHSFTYLKEEPSSCDGGNIKDHTTEALDPTQHYLKGELDLQDGETITTPNIYVTEDHAQQRSPPRVHEEPLPSSGGDLICNAQSYPATHVMEATNLPDMNPPESQSQVNDLNVQFSCSECKKCFASMAELVSHQGVHIAEKLLQSRTHVFTTTIVQVSQVEPVKHKLLTCSTCGRTFYTKSSLVGHMKTHWDKVSETFRCNYCGKSFPTKSLLNLHSRLHFGHRPYVCSLCGERFMRNCDLGRHQKKHQ